MNNSSAASRSARNPPSRVRSPLLLCELTGTERAAFTNTGSEAILAAVRLARTVTGRTRIATCGGFHGINDEVLVRANVVDGKRRSLPVAPGIPEHIVSDVLVLDYGTAEGLELLRAHAHELAAVLVEPVQSRRPGFAAARVPPRRSARSPSRQAVRWCSTRSSTASAVISAARRRTSASARTSMTYGQGDRRRDAHRRGLQAKPNTSTRSMAGCGNTATGRFPKWA